MSKKERLYSGRTFYFYIQYFLYCPLYFNNCPLVGAVSEEKQFRWDMFVKNIIDIPRCQYIALIYGTGLSDGMLYIINVVSELSFGVGNTLLEKWIQFIVLKKQTTMISILNKA